MKTLNQHIGQKGAAAVEFAIVAPLLFILIFGMIEFGIILYDKAMITNASREGARYAILYNGEGMAYDTAEIRAAVNNKLYTADDPPKLLLISLGDSVSVPTITPTWEDAAKESGSNVTVEVQYTYSFLVLHHVMELIGASWNGDIHLDSRTTMRME